MLVVLLHRSSTQLAMHDAVVYFDNNFRHPLIYDTQVIPGDEIDAYMALMNCNPNARRRRRGRRTTN